MTTIPTKIRLNHPIAAPNHQPITTKVMSDQITALKHEIARLREKNRQLRASQTEIVTLELVGEENYRNNPFCHNAVNARLPVSEFINFLLKENQRLTEGLTNCEKYRTIPYPIAVDRQSTTEIQ